MSTPTSNPASSPILVVGDAQSEKGAARPQGCTTEKIESLLSDIHTRPNLRRGVVAATIAAIVMTAIWLVASAAIRRPLLPASLLVGAAIGLAMRWHGRGLTLGFNAAGMTIWSVAHSVALSVSWFVIRPAGVNTTWRMDVWGALAVLASGCVVYCLSRGSVSESEMADLLRIGDP